MGSHGMGLNGGSGPTVAFDRQPTLVGDLLELRPLRADDFEGLYAVASDPLLWEQHPDKERHQEPVFRKLFEEALESGGALVVIDREAGRIIGSSRYLHYEPERSEVEIGWTFLARSHWGGSYNGEMKRLMLEHAFRFVHQVVFVVSPDNIRSQRALEKIGAERIGTRIDERGHEGILFGITAASAGIEPK
jgi:N-acetyltransferase